MSAAGSYYITRTKSGGFELRIHFNAPPAEEDHFIALLDADKDKARQEARDIARTVVPVYENGWVPCLQKTPASLPSPNKQIRWKLEKGKDTADVLPYIPSESSKFKGAKDGIPQNEWAEDPLVSWGKYKGSKMSEVPKSYLHWMISEWEDDGPAWQKPYLKWARAHIND